MSPLSAGRTSALAGAFFGAFVGLVLALLGTAVAVVFHVGYWLTVIAVAALVFARSWPLLAACSTRLSTTL